MRRENDGFNNKTAESEAPISNKSTQEQFSEEVGSYSDFEEHLARGGDGQESATSCEEESSTLRPRKKRVYRDDGIFADGDNAMWKILTVLIAVILALVAAYWVTSPLFDKVIIRNQAIVKKDKKAQDGHDRTSIPKKLFKQEYPKHDWQAHLSSLQKNGENLKTFSDEEIKYREGGKLYLVLVGLVFDVSNAPKVYGKDSRYHGFVGHDGSRAFVTGKFDEKGLISDLGGLTSDENKAISNWINFYLNHEVYQFVGLHNGWFFDKNGKKTRNMIQLEKALLKAEELKKTYTEVEKVFPGCNMEWTSDKGSYVWCSKLSGGISREWVGFPRNFSEAGKNARCACVHPNNLADPRVSLYKGCNPRSELCSLKEE